MTSDQMWQAYKILNQTIGDKIDAWAFAWKQIIWQNSY